jgi:hypothetical protein
MRQLEPEANPVKKLLCVVTNYEAEVRIDEMDHMDLAGDDNRAHQGGVSNEANVRALYAQQTARSTESIRFT